jgi:hypothetical protein
VLEHAVAEHAVEGARGERKVEEVRLDEVQPLALAEVRAHGVDGRGGVDGPDLRAGLEQDFREAAGAAPELEHPLAVESLRPAGPPEQPVVRDRLARDRVELDAPVAVPLLAEALGVAVIRNEPRNPVASVERGPGEQPYLG